MYEAAQIIQKAYRSYKGRKIKAIPAAPDSQDREARAAIVIQNYYRRYKQNGKLEMSYFCDIGKIEWR